MTLKDIIPNSIYCTIGYCDEKHLETLEQYIQQNKFLLELFDKISIAYNGEREKCLEAIKIWNDRFPGKLLFGILPINRGQTYGTMDLDNEVIRLGLISNKDYIWKTSADTIFFEQILEKEIAEADFYYLNGIGYAGLERFNSEYFFPQTNFYIISSNIDYLNDENEVDEVYELQKVNPNKRPWELKQGFESETFLKRCVERNKLWKFHLCNDSYFRKIMNVVRNYQIHDSSHKNLIIEDPGVSHLHYPDKPAYSISILNEHI